MGDHVRFLEHLYPTLFSRFNASASLGTIAHSEGGKVSLRINAGSNNYAGFGSVDEHTEVFLKALMDSNIPLANTTANQPFIEAYEAEMKKTYQSADAIHTVSGYTANMIAFAGMTTPDTIWLMDSHSHNSMFMGARLSKSKAIVKFDHNDMDSLELKLQEFQGENATIVVALEGLYSMSGSYPDAYRLAQLKQEYNFDILCDECHSFCSIGEKGTGFVEQCVDLDPEHRSIPDFIDVRTGGMGKSVGCHGGWITCTEKYRDALRKKSEEYRSEEDPIFLPAILGCLYTILHREVVVTKLHRIRQMVTYARDTLTNAGLHVYGDYPSPIVVVYCGSMLKAPALANKALEV